MLITSPIRHQHYGLITHELDTAMLSRPHICGVWSSFVLSTIKCAVSRNEYIIKCVCYCLKEQSSSTPDMKVRLEQNKNIEISNDILRMHQLWTKEEMLQVCWSNLVLWYFLYYTIITYSISLYSIKLWTRNMTQIKIIFFELLFIGYFGWHWTLEHQRKLIYF